ncbi:MAG: hypothetical protein U1F52_11760 [Burkholderiales bacterium]
MSASKNMPMYALRTGERRRSTVLPIVLIIGFIVVALLVGAAAGVGLALYEVALVVGGFIAAAAWIGRNTWMAQGSVGIFWSAIVLTFGTAFISTFSPRPINGLMELWLLALAGLAVASYVEWAPRCSVLKWSTALFLIFLTFAGISSVYGGSKPIAAVYQFLYDLKFPFMLLLGFRVGWRESTERGFWRLTNWLWLPLIIVVAWQLLSPSSFSAIAVGVTDKLEAKYGNPFIPGLRARATGPFPHSGHLALFAVFFASICAIRMISQGLRSAGFMTTVAFLGYLALTLLSGQRQELAALLMIIGAMFIVYRIRSVTSAAIGVTMASVLGLIVVIALLGHDQVERLKDEWGFGSAMSPLTAPRTVFFWDSIKLADKAFPFGTGLGTFAGEGARLFDHSYYDSLGYGRFWWYKLQLFLVDTYWPNFIAEAGWFGALAFFLIPVLIVLYAFSRSWRESDPFAKRLWAMAFAGNAIALVVSLTSPLYSDPNFVAVILMMFGMAYGLTYPAAEQEGTSKRGGVGRGIVNAATVSRARI